MRMLKKIVIVVVIVLFVVLLGIQVLPGGRDHKNPPTISGPNWDSPETEALARRACFDCHSNETKWPWYASIAPLSWRIEEHVEMGRKHLNFSEFDKLQKHADEAAQEVEGGHMPLWDYLILHPEARLSDSEKQKLIQGLIATFGDRREQKSESR